MTDRTDHRSEAEWLLADADEWAAQAGELSPEASERACLDRAQVHALLALRDALTDRPETEWNFNEVRWRREVMPWEGALASTPCGDCAKHDAYAANEARQREAEPETPEAAEWLSLDEDDPLDEDDHRDRLDRDGYLVRRKPNGYWAWVALVDEADGWTLSSLNASFGPLTFAPEPPQEATGDDQSASEGESDAEEGGEAEEAAAPLWCPRCGHHIDDHHGGTCVTRCECTALPSVIAQALIRRADEQAGDGRG